jgi:CHRD domain
MKSVSMIAAVCIGFAASSVFAKDDDDDSDKFGARLSGYNEVHFSAGPPATLRGAVSTKGKGRFKAEINDAATSISYELSYQDLEGTVTQAHIHFGQHHSVGGIVVWLCQTSGTLAPESVRAVTPQCPASGTVVGTISPTQVLAQTAQGIDAGQFDELVRAIRAGATYANVHTTLHPPGEIRGQLRERGDHKH